MNDEIRYAVPQEKLVAVMSAAFNLSRPQGLGFLHFKSGDADARHEAWFKEEADRVIAADPSETYMKGIHMDYVEGRACKFSIRYDADGWYVEGPRWYDHSPDQLLELVKHCGLAERAKATT